MKSVDIYLPTFGRADRLPQVLQNIIDNTQGKYRVVFILEKDDLASINKVQELKQYYVINKRSKTYGGAINTSWQELESDIFFTGADDLSFRQGWLENALKCFDGKHRVVGTQDLHNSNVTAGLTATHYFVEGSYIKEFTGTIDQSYPVLYEYDHNWTDQEAVDTAKYRNEFVMCFDSVVEHLHYTFGLSKMDATYTKTRQHISEDQAIFNQRRKLWSL